MSRRSTSLRQTRTPNISLELQMPTLSPVLSSLSTIGSTTTTPKKSNWEVIEHFNSTEKGRGSVSSSLIAVRKIHRKRNEFWHGISLCSHISYLMREGK